MFRKQTLFILGAGASAEVDLPIGDELARRISAMLDVHAGGVHNNVGETLLAELYNSHPLANRAYHRAAVAISDGVRLTRSIDDFLDRHSHDPLIQLVGKTAIVKSILDAEGKSAFALHPRSRATLDRLEKTWYVKFFRMLGTDLKVPDVRQIFDKVAFVVFNYDRCLEYFLFNALQQAYGTDANEAAAIISDLHLIHPYGVVADLQTAGGGVPYGYSSELNHGLFSKNIKIYTEQLAAGELLKDIHDEMLRAEQIIFLGFGFHEMNLILLSPDKKLPNIPVFGTLTNASDHNRDAIHTRLSTLFKPAPPRITPWSPIVLDNKVTCRFARQLRRVHYGSMM